MEELAKVLPADLLPSVQELFDEFSLAGMKSAGVEVQEVKGYRLTPGVTTDALQYAYDEWSFREGDVLLGSFPKTGTNWTLDIIRRLLYDESSYNLCKNLPLSTLILEAGSPLKFSVLDKLPLKRRLMGTHLPAELLNLKKLKESKAKLIYVYRNPKDQLVSWFHFIQKIPHLVNHPLGHMINQGFNNFFEHALKGDLPIGTKPGEGYANHLFSFYEHKNDGNVLLLCFEDLKKDFRGQVEQVAKFLDIEITNDRILEVEKLCSFQTMKENIDTNKNQQLQEFQTANMRKGDVGSWEEVLTDEQSKLVDEKFNQVLNGTDVKFVYSL
uniref:Sulfotransferase n=1 Tax=Phallusia mammillata TaxID=59560 RepID=A0A6F9DTC6_9ASCI|nr:sulfotransferase family cytosolic 1B member 1 [Phallusia mammillata]